jgi:LmbE family N-acetylglucosaminyl deacetylase
MLTASLGKDRAPLRILCLGAHCDDIEIGCGGFMLRLLAEHPQSTVHWVVFSSNAERAAEARNSATEILAAADRSTVQIHGFRESFFPYLGTAIKELFERLKADIDPELVLTHHLDDRHQDHRTIAELTWNTFRDHLIAEYEIPKYEGDLGHPNIFVPLPAEVARQKVELLLRNFPSQAARAWFRAETFESLMRLRGIESNAPDGFAEAFHVRKLTL